MLIHVPKSRLSGSNPQSKELMCDCYGVFVALSDPVPTTYYSTPYVLYFIFIMTSYTKGTRKIKKFKKNHMVEKYEIKNSTSCAKHGRLTYIEPSLMKITSSSMRAISTVP